MRGRPVTRILVVDDMAIFREPIAASLRRADYDAVCASNGKEALDLMCGELPDLVLLDIAMPVMDGLSCLKLMRKWSLLRDIPVIILTAASERATLTEAVRLGVQGYLLKSQFSLDVLLDRVRKVLAANGGPATPTKASAPPETPGQSGANAKASTQAAPQPTPLSREETLKHVHRHAKLRAVPTVLQHVMSLTGSRRTSFDDVGSAVRKDHALALRVMKVANSSFFGTGAGVQTLAEAAQRIGMTGVRNTIASILTIEHFAASSTGGLTPQRFWEHSLATAVLAEGIGGAIGMEHSEHMFLAGLMHDVGRLVLSTHFPTHYEWVVQSGATRNVDVLDVEREAFGLGHDAVTSEMLTQWQTPEDIREAACAHEHPVDRIQEKMRDPQSALVVALANRLAHAALLGDSGNTMLLTFGEHARALKLKGDAIRSLVHEAAEKTQETEIFYASRTDQSFKRPLLDEFRASVGDAVNVRVFAGGSRGDPLSLLSERLGWSGARKPRCAMLFVPSPRALTTRINELLKFEDEIGTRLAVLIASPDVSAEPPPELTTGRRWASVQVPGHYAPLIEAVGKLCDTPELEGALPESGRTV